MLTSILLMRLACCTGLFKFFMIIQEKTERYRKLLPIRAVIPNQWAVAQYQAVGHSVPVSSGRKIASIY